MEWRVGLILLKIMGIKNKSFIRNMYSEYIMSSYWEICLETQIRTLSSHRNNRELEQAPVMPVCLVKWCMWICSRLADKEKGGKK